jgi:hypothetical protein
LGNRHGTEGWSGDDKGGHSQANNNKAGKDDPLNKRNGTEGW